MRKNTRILAVALAALALAGLPRTATAQLETDNVEKAKTFLTNEAKGSLGFIQTGCTYKGVSVRDVMRNQDGSFKITMRYDWSGLDNGNDYSEIHYAFSTTGRLTDLQVGPTTASVFTPYSVADIGINLLRDALVKDVQKMPADDPIRRAIEPLIRGANARTIHLLTLKLRQPR